MTRAVTGDTVVLKPSNNIYTVLLIAATVAQVVGLVVLFVREYNLFGQPGKGFLNAIM